MMMAWTKMVAVDTEAGYFGMYLWGWLGELAVSGKGIKEDSYAFNFPGKWMMGLFTAIWNIGTPHLLIQGAGWGKKVN